MEAYWPYAAKQQEPIAELLERYKLWKHAISVMIDYFVSLQQLDKSHIKEITRLTTRLGEIEAQFGAMN
jgi:hypothetical protein